MTTQQRDTIQYQGEIYSIDDEPLSSLGKLPDFAGMSTANHRGYVASWSIVDGSLFLDDLSGWCPGSDKSALELVFPGMKTPIAAAWYSGNLLLQGGELVRLLGDFDAWYEREFSITIVNGKVLGAARAHSREGLARYVFDPILFAKVEDFRDLGLTPSIVDALHSASINLVGDLVAVGGEDQLRVATRLSEQDVATIKEALAQLGLTFGKFEGWPPERVVR